MDRSPEKLTEKRCKPCEGGIAPLARDAIEGLLKELPGWTVAENGAEISRTFDFGNYYETMAFVNATAWVSHRENHHPDLEVGYRRCLVRYTTHAIGGLSENDFICAAMIGVLLSSEP